MALTFTARFQIRLYELDSHGELPNSGLARLLQETAMRATRNAGFPNDWFTARKSVWVIHEMILEHLGPIRYPDELEITTWLSDIQRVRTHREYVVRNAATQEIIARVSTLWAHLNVETLAPARIPQEINERFAPNGIRAIARLAPRTFGRDNPAPPREFCTQRRVQRYETDAMQHVNNTIYLDWVEEALADAAEDWTGLKPGTESSVRLCVRRHDLAYARPALPRDQVDIRAQMIGAGHCASTWSVQVKRNDELLVRDHVTALWVDSKGNPVRWK